MAGPNFRTQRRCSRRKRRARAQPAGPQGPVAWTRKRTGPLFRAKRRPLATCNTGQRAGGVKGHAPRAGIRSGRAAAAPTVASAGWSRDGGGEPQGCGFGGVGLTVGGRRDPRTVPRRTGPSSCATPRNARPPGPIAGNTARRTRTRPASAAHLVASPGDLVAARLVGLVGRRSSRTAAGGPALYSRSGPAEAKGRDPCTRARQPAPRRDRLIEAREGKARRQWTTGQNPRRSRPW